MARVRECRRACMSLMDGCPGRGVPHLSSSDGGYYRNGWMRGQNADTLSLVFADDRCIF